MAVQQPLMESSNGEEVVKAIRPKLMKPSKALRLLEHLYGGSVDAN